MKNHLKVLEEIIEIRLNPLTTEYSADLEEALSLVQSEQSLIKKCISSEVNTQVDIKAIKLYIQRNQVNLIHILDSLTDKIESTININKINPLQVYKLLLGVQKAVYIIVENILCYLGYRYYQYCNPNIRVSEKYRYLFLRKLEKEINEIEYYGVYLNHELLEIAMLPVKNQINNSKKGLTYTMVLFYKELIRVINDLRKIENKSEHEDELIRSLIFINFNSVYFVKYCVRKMMLGLEKQFQIVDKIEFLALYLKRINQTPVRGGMALFKNYPHAKDLLSQWVLAEICYWERKLQLHAPFKNDKNFLIDTNIKIATDLSVSQLACFIRLLVETGTYINSRKEDILEFYTQHYKSKKCESIEYGSFRSKYYAISESTKDHIKNLIIAMLNELRNL